MALFAKENQAEEEFQGGLDVKTDGEEEGIKKNNINWGKSWKSDGGKGIKILFRGI